MRGSLVGPFPGRPGSKGCLKRARPAEAEGLERAARDVQRALVTADVAPHFLVLEARLTPNGRLEVAEDHRQRRGLPARVVQRAQREVPRAIPHVPGGAPLRPARAGLRSIALALTAMMVERDVCACMRMPAERDRLVLVDPIPA